MTESICGPSHAAIMTRNLLCLHDKATHMPWQPAERFRKQFDNQAIPEPATLFDDYRGRTAAVRLSILQIGNLSRWQEKISGAPPASLTADRQRRWLYQQYMRHHHKPPWQRTVEELKVELERVRSE